MPRYEYECPKCGSFEVTQRISDAPLERHECGEAVERRISKTAFSLKGGGWYADGYGGGSKNGGDSKSEACSPTGCAKVGCPTSSSTTAS
jgi:putative FmdB family regulatory protein